MPIHPIIIDVFKVIIKVANLQIALIIYETLYSFIVCIVDFCFHQVTINIKCEPLDIKLLVLLNRTIDLSLLSLRQKGKHQWV